MFGLSLGTGDEKALWCFYTTFPKSPPVGFAGRETLSLKVQGRRLLPEVEIFVPVSKYDTAVTTKVAN